MRSHENIHRINTPQGRSAIMMGDNRTCNTYHTHTANHRWHQHYSSWETLKWCARVLNAVVAVIVMGKLDMRLTMWAA